MTAASLAEASYPPELIATPTKYRLSRRLGAGGMGEVLLGTMQGAEGFERSVAVKILHAEFAHFPELLAMFAHEANIASRLNHPNLVNVIDFNRDAQGRLFLVMEYVDGLTLSDVLRRAPAMPPSVATFIATEILRGLAYAHHPGDALTGVVHRDLSPRNVLVSWRGAVKVSDFGIAKAIRTSGVSGTFRGTPAYMSPEHARQSTLDHRADLFSLGVIWWEMLTGQRLFNYPTVKKQLDQVLHAPILEPRLVRPDVPEAVERIVLRLLERDRDKRYARAEDVIAELAGNQELPRGTPEELAAFLAEHVRRDGAREDATTLTAPSPISSESSLPSVSRSPSECPKAQGGASQPAAPRAVTDAQPSPSSVPSIKRSAPTMPPPAGESYRRRAKLLIAAATVALVAGHPALDQQAHPRLAKRALEKELAADAMAAPVPTAPKVSTPSHDTHRSIIGYAAEAQATVESAASRPTISEPVKRRGKRTERSEPPPLDFVRIQLIDGKANHL